MVPQSKIIYNSDNPMYKFSKRHEKNKPILVASTHVQACPTSGSGCVACDQILRMVRRHNAKTTRAWAKQNLQGHTLTHPEFPKTILITGGGINEFTNQPHKHYCDKNDLLKDIHNVLNGSEYKGVTEHKGRTSHIFEIELMGEKSWIIANAYEGRGVVLHSISESEKVLIGIKK